MVQKVDPESGEIEEVDEEIQAEVEKDLVAADGLPVRAPSGAEYKVLTAEEVASYEDIAKRYLEHNSFSNMSDLQELDRIIIMELIFWRWSNWLSLEKDYWGDPIDVDEQNKRLKILSGEIRLVKKGLGVDKSSRDKDRGSSLAEYIENLGRRAKEFGYHREKQFEQGMILINEVIAKAIWNGNADDIEKKELHVSDREVLDWIRDDVAKRYNDIDNHFKMNTQRFWIRDQ